MENYRVARAGVEYFTLTTKKLTKYDTSVKEFQKHLPYVVLFVIFLITFFWGLSVGILGHDYFYFLPKLLDGKWHFLRQGLSMFYYTPHMCGGFPEFANPQSMYYSLQQLLVLFLDMWVAVRLTILTSMILGYIGWYKFARDIVRLNLQWAHVLALIVSAHGFHFMHMIPGHIVFHSMPIIGWLLWMLFDRRNVTLKNLLVKGAWFALSSAYILYSGGYMVFVMCAFAFIAFLPYELLLHYRSLRIRITILCKNIAVCATGTLLICASKLVAMLSFIRFFPREVPFERLWDDTSVIVFIARTFFALPQNDDLYWEFGMPKWGAFHEYSFLISPVVFIGLLCGIILLWNIRRALLQNKIFAFTCTGISLILLLWIVQLTRGYGWMVTPLEHLPIFRGLHVNMRWLYAFSFPLIAVSIWSIQTCITRCKYNRYSWILSLLAGAITIVAFIGGYYGILHGNTLPRTLLYNEISEALNSQEGYMKLDVDEAFDMRGLGHSGFIPLIFGGNHIYCSEPMLLGTSALPDSITVAPIMQERDGALNMYNPACMVYPKENNCNSGDRIRIEDRENAQRFRTGKPTTWHMSVIQHVSNWISVLSYFACLLIILGKALGFSLHR